MTKQFRISSVDEVFNWLKEGAGGYGAAMEYTTGTWNEGLFMHNLLKMVPDSFKFFYRIHIVDDSSINILKRKIIEKIEQYQGLKLFSYLYSFKDDRAFALRWDISEKDKALIFVRIMPKEFFNKNVCAYISIASSESIPRSPALFSFVKYLLKIEKEYRRREKNRNEEEPFFKLNIHFKDSVPKSCLPPDEEATIPIIIYKDFEKTYPLVNYFPIRDKIISLEDNFKRLLMESDEAPQRIIILEGPSGTGKTYYLRRILSVLYDAGLLPTVKYFIGEAAFSLTLRDIIEPKNPEKCIIFILEEVEPLIVSSNGKRNIHLAKLLNYAGGLLDLRTFFILTTNLPVIEIDPALVREGRLLAHIKFKKFTKKEEIVEWCEFHGISKENGIRMLKEKEELTLAELYAFLKKQKTIKPGREEKAVGFKLGG